MNRTDRTLEISEGACFEWLFGSGIHDTTVHGIRHYYNSLSRRYGPVYTEITGYAVKYLLNHGKWTGQSDSLRVAQEFGRFIHEAILDLGTSETAIRFGFDTGKDAWIESCYSFDTGICAASLMDLSRYSATSSDRDAALNLAYALVRRGQNPEGSFKALLHRDTSSNSHQIGWFGDQATLHLKLAIPLYKAYELTGDKTFVDSYSKLFRWARAMQLPNGSFKSSESERFVFTHSHCYALESLAFLYGSCQEKDALDSLSRGIEWLLAIQGRDGSFHDFYPRKRLPWKRTDATAQACRMFVGMYLLKGDQKYLAAAHRALEFVRRCQTRSHDKRIDGGIPSKKAFGVAWPEYNSWGGLFFAHALHLVSNLESYDFGTFVQELF